MFSYLHFSYYSHLIPLISIVERQFYEANLLHDFKCLFDLSYVIDLILNLAVVLPVLASRSDYVLQMLMTNIGPIILQ